MVPLGGAHRKGCYRGRMSTARGAQGKDRVRTMCTTEGQTLRQTDRMITLGHPHPRMRRP
jgi:hypothetical protein